ncbi:transglutaminase family protein [soil metagenome]
MPMLMLVRPRPDADHRTVYESRWLEPEVPVHEYADGFGNLCWRFLAPGAPLTVRYDAVVEIEGRPDTVVPDAPLERVQDLPDDALVHTLPSRFVESDLLVDTAWTLFGATPATWARVQAICDWVHANITFGYGSSSPTTTAAQIFEQRKGVCRDFALLAVAFCRAMNIPARYTFDARFNTSRICRIVIGRGRDAVDVALSTSYGTAHLEKFVVWADEITAERPGGPSREPYAYALEDADRRLA